MRALKSRQATLLAMQQEAETKLASTRQKSNEGKYQFITFELFGMFLAVKMFRLLDGKIKLITIIY